MSNFGKKHMFRNFFRIKNPATSSLCGKITPAPLFKTSEKIAAGSAALYVAHRFYKKREQQKRNEEIRQIDRKLLIDLGSEIDARPDGRATPSETEHMQKLVRSTHKRMP
jgi:hypothetical protein